MDNQARDPAELEREIQSNVDWADYLRRIDDEVKLAEEHLSVPPGAISGIQKEPEYLFIVKVFAALEPIVNELLATRLAFGRKATYKHYSARCLHQKPRRLRSCWKSSHLCR